MIEAVHLCVYAWQPPVALAANGLEVCDHNSRFRPARALPALEPGALPKAANAPGASLIFAGAFFDALSTAPHTRRALDLILEVYKVEKIATDQGITGEAPCAPAGA